MRFHFVSMPVWGMFAYFAVGWTLRIMLLYGLLVGIARLARSPVVVTGLLGSEHRIGCVAG